jgi:hypothetical protein
MNADEMKTKLHSFSAIASGLGSFMKPPYTDPDYILKSIKSGRSLYNMYPHEHQYVQSPLSSAPWFVQANSDSEAGLRFLNYSKSMLDKL